MRKLVFMLSMLCCKSLVNEVFGILLFGRSSSVQRSAGNIGAKGLASPGTRASPIRLWSMGRLSPIACNGVV
ncbi:MAG TPA: hypothetical protein QF753_22760 [Victivallales bacterium]|nr:hypothetical protein [Victivallales bacterium]